MPTSTTASTPEQDPNLHRRAAPEEGEDRGALVSGSSYRAALPVPAYDQGRETLPGPASVLAEWPAVRRVARGGRA